MTNHPTTLPHYCFLFICLAAIGCNSVGSIQENSGQLSKQERDAAKATLKELKKLASYTEAGISYQEYQTRVLDAKGEIDSQLLDIPSGPIKDALTKALAAYVDARKFWGLAVQREGKDNYFYLKKDEMEQFSKYGVGKNKGLTGSRMVPVFWLHGDGHTEIAEEIISK